MNGHCFVALAISVPVCIGESVRYLNIPIGFRLRSKKENKLQIASQMIEEAMVILADYPMTILLCDSWYPKGAVRKTVMRYKNLALVANVRVDTSLFELPPPKTGKRGRPAKKGNPIDIHADLHYIRIDDYYIAVKQVLTNLFDTPVYLTVTTSNLDKPDSFRVFISTLMPEVIQKQFHGVEKHLSTSLSSQMTWLLPLHLYSYRWAIEVCFYEMKTFWSFGLYMLRSKQGIENFVNTLCMSYACMKILPFADHPFSFLTNESVQTAKYVIGDTIKQELFLWRFVSQSENAINYHALFSDIQDPFERFKRSDIAYSLFL